MSFAFQKKVSLIQSLASCSPGFQVQVARKFSRRAGHYPTLSLAIRDTKRWATSKTPHSTASDPAEEEALLCLEQGTQKLEEGDVEGAKKLYQRSVDIKRNASSLFNLGVTHYHLKEFNEAIHSWKSAIEFQPSSADAHTNLASAYLNHSQTRPDLALQHLQIAAKLAPEDPEIAFNLASVLEAFGRLPEALEHYKRSKRFGVDRAAVHIKDVSARIEKQSEGTNGTTTKSSTP
ncbi:TPR-like protein [Multifurca ochricompacta]|uniref:TPR-like protein n=1 Tax=Multifurca ochricompacta TaxID=376703 RepID=A0AAD4MB46_9AGAM|nr:TPR-like protein [Multifurca ochricompacta]